MIAGANVRQHLLFCFGVSAQASGGNELGPIVLGLAVDVANTALAWVCCTPDQQAACFNGLRHAGDNILRFAGIDVLCHF